MKLWTRTQPLWREEFSVRAADERYVTRRQFGKFLVLTSLAMFAGNVWIVVKSWLQATPKFSAQPVALLQEIPIGGVKLFRYPGPEDACILVRTADDAYVAYSQQCTHLSCAVYYDPRSNRLECPCHQGAFAITDGRVLQGPPPRPLPRIALERRGTTLVAVGISPATEA